MSVSRETSGWRNRPDSELLMEGANSLGLTLTPAQVEQLLAYWNELRRWNTKVNLIGPARPPEQIVLHLLDSLAPLPLLPEDPLRVLDLGSGGGLPGLVLKILRPDWDLTLVESRERKAAFLRHVGRFLHLTGLTVEEVRADPLTETIPRQTFHLVTARGLGPLDRILPLAAAYLAPRGRFLAYKGPGADDELAEAAALCSALGFTLTTDHRFLLPFMEHERVVLIFQMESV